MKKKYLAIIISLFFILTSLNGCSTADTTESGSTETTDENVIYGEVTNIDDSSITITIGTLQTPEQNGESPEESTNESVDKTDEPNQEMRQQISLTLTDEEKVILVSDDTQIILQGSIHQPNDNENGNTPPDGNDENGNTSSDSDDENGNTPPDGNDENGNTPPDGNDENGSFPMDQSEEEISFSDIEEDDIIAVVMGDDETAEKITLMSNSDAPGAAGAGDDEINADSYTAVEHYTSNTEITDETISSTGSDENAILISDEANVSLDNCTVTRTSEDSTGGDNSSFYGIGAAILTTEGNSYISNSSITTDADGGAGIFAYGDGTAYTSNTTISTTQDTSGGIHVAGGGTLYAWDMNIETNGESSAAIRSDRGGGLLVANGGTYVSNGTGSPAIYSTADIAVNNADLTANGSEAICIEGQNSVYLYQSNLSGNMQDDTQNDCTWNVILYQSMSGDSEEGNSIFEMNGGTLTAKNGGMFYTTNTESTITLKDVEMTYSEDNAFLLRCTGNANARGWGQTGSNGADCLFTAIEQELNGDIIWDSISELEIYLTEESVLQGAFVQDETYAGNGGDGFCQLVIDENSTWIVTGDSVLTILACSGSIMDDSGKSVTIQGTDGTVYVEGNSNYTITVDAYETTADVSGASTVTAWETFETAQPANLNDN